MIYQLDTNTCVEYLRHGSTSTVAAHLATVPEDDIGLSTVVIGELLFGALRSKKPILATSQVEAFVANYDIVLFDKDAAEEYAAIREYLTSQGQVIGSNDMLIAATARLHGSILVTHNTAEFSRVPGLRLEDWQLP